MSKAIGSRIYGGNYPESVHLALHRVLLPVSILVLAKAETNVSQLRGLRMTYTRWYLLLTSSDTFVESSPLTVIALCALAVLVCKDKELAA